ncbi:class I SAM-dependent methyltransferase [Nocardia sp. NPDC059240]|uniref:class I SAM-dependent methyltransferase n=1 Tax=Nocardia sp. NPDC059240 TaxID=3346786 RepID=UPI0036BC2775
MEPLAAHHRHWQGTSFAAVPNINIAGLPGKLGMSSTREIGLFAIVDLVGHFGHRGVYDLLVQCGDSSRCAVVGVMTVPMSDRSGEPVSWTAQFGQFADDQALAYDRVLVPAVFASLAQRLAAVAVDSSVHSVLDVGTGSGVVARAIAARLQPGAQIVGVDLSPRFVELASEHIPPQGVSMRFQIADAVALPLADAGFDLVVCQHVLQFVPGLSGAIAEMVRVTAPGGHLWVVVWSELADSPLFAAVADLVERTWGSDAHEVFTTPWSLPVERIAAEMTGAGVKAVIVQRLTVDVEFDSAQEAMWVLVLSPVGRRVLGMGQRERETFAHDFAESIAPWTTTQARVRAPMTAWVVSGHRG